MNILITGASKGIGFETVLQFAKNKTNTVIGISRNGYKGPNGNSNIISIRFDLEKGNIETDLLPEIKQHISSLDILINNAGTLILKPFDQTADEDWKHTFEVNFFSVSRLIKSLLPLLQKTKSEKSHIVNMSSMAGFQGASKYPGLSAYSASKGALATLTESLAVELAEKNIAVNCLCPGGVDTEMFKTAFPGSTAGMTAVEMAKKIFEFSTTAHQTMTGKIIRVTKSDP